MEPDIYEAMKTNTDTPKLILASRAQSISANFSANFPGTKHISQLPGHEAYKSASWARSI